MFGNYEQTVSNLFIQMQQKENHFSIPNLKMTFKKKITQKKMRQAIFDEADNPHFDVEVH